MKHFVAGVAFAIPELWESSTLAKLDERKDSIALDFEPLSTPLSSKNSWKERDTDGLRQTCKMRAMN